MLFKQQQMGSVAVEDVLFRLDDGETAGAVLEEEFLLGLLVELGLLGQEFVGILLLDRVGGRRTGQTSGRGFARDNVHVGNVFEPDLELFERFRHATRQGIT